VCGRFTLRTPAENLAQSFGVDIPAEYIPRYNIAPTQPILSVMAEPDKSRRKISFMRWGLVPPWAKDTSVGMINARAESVAVKPSFKKAFLEARCLIPADGWYEWKHDGKGKQPYYFHLKENLPFSFAGLWSRWKEKDTGKTLDSCAIITTMANEKAAAIHDRMPVVLSPDIYEAWLDPLMKKTEELISFLKPFPSEDILAYPVSTVVNSGRVDSPKCIESLENK